MDGRSRLSRWIAENPGTVDRLLIGAGFVAGLIAFVNSPHVDDPIVNVAGAIAAGAVIAVVIAWSRRRQRNREDLARRVVLDERIRPVIVFAVVRRELLEIVRNRALLGAIVIPPVLLVAFPILATAYGHKDPLPAEIVRNLVASRPAWSSFSPTQLVDAFGLQQMGMFFLMPATIPLAVASYSIVGEKQTRSLEAVIAAPISTEELLAGKAIAAIAPAVGTVWLAYGALIAVAGVVLGPQLATVVIDPTWLVTVFALGPAIGLISVVAGIAISSRVNDPRAAQQIGTVIILPLVGFAVLQFQSGKLLGSDEYLAAAGVLVLVGIAGLRVAARLFGRESILTRWR